MYFLSRNSHLCCFIGTLSEITVIIVFGPHQVQKCSGLIPSSVFRILSWQCSGDDSGFWDKNRVGCVYGKCPVYCTISVASEFVTTQCEKFQSPESTNTLAGGILRNDCCRPLTEPGKRETHKARWVSWHHISR